MKIPLMIGILVMLLSGCNPSIRDVPLTPPEPSVASSVADYTKAVIVREKPSIRAQVFVVKDVVMVQYDDGKQQRLTGINPALYVDFQAIFFRIQDKNRDGLKEIAVLAGTNLGASERCYDVFHYNLRLGVFERKWADFYCTLR